MCTLPLPQGVLSILSTPVGPPFAFRGKEESAATAEGGQMLLKKLPLGVLWLSLDTEIVMALPSVQGTASPSAGPSPEGLQPPPCWFPAARLCSSSLAASLGCWQSPWWLK